MIKVNYFLVLILKLKQLQLNAYYCFKKIQLVCTNYYL